MDAIGRAIAALFLVLAVASAWAQSATPEELAAVLAEARGLEYVAAREQVLTTQEQEFNAVVAALRAPGASHRRAAIATAVELRRAQPGWATEFDEVLQAAWNMAPRGKTGPAPMLRHHLVDAGRFRPFTVELLLKRSDSPRELRSAAVVLMSHQGSTTPSEVVGLLAVLEDAAELGTDFGVLARIAVDWAIACGDDRIVETIVVGYDRYRERHPGDVDTPHLATVYLTKVNTPGALFAMRAIVTAEHARMQASGFHPWDDPDAEMLYRDAVDERRQMSAAASAQGAPLPPEIVVQLDSAVEAAHRRCRSKILWQSLNETLALLEGSQGGGE